MENTTETPMVLIEVQIGTYLVRTILFGTKIATVGMNQMVNKREIIDLSKDYFNEKFGKEEFIPGKLTYHHQAKC